MGRCVHGRAGGQWGEIAHGQRAPTVDDSHPPDVPWEATAALSCGAMHFEATGGQWHEIEVGQELSPDSDPRAPIVWRMHRAAEGLLGDEQPLFVIGPFLQMPSRIIFVDNTCIPMCFLFMCVTTFFLQATTSTQASHRERHCDNSVPSKCSPSSSKNLWPLTVWGAIVTLVLGVSDNLAFRLVQGSKAVIRAPFRRRYNPKITSSLQTPNTCLCQSPPLHHRHQTNWSMLKYLWFIRSNFLWLFQEPGALPFIPNIR